MLSIVTAMWVIHRANPVTTFNREDKHVDFTKPAWKSLQPPLKSPCHVTMFTSHRKALHLPDVRNHVVSSKNKQTVSVDDISLGILLFIEVSDDPVGSKPTFIDLKSIGESILWWTRAGSQELPRISIGCHFDSWIIIHSTWLLLPSIIIIMTRIQRRRPRRRLHLEARSHPHPHLSSMVILLTNPVLGLNTNCFRKEIYKFADWTTLGPLSAKSWTQNILEDGKVTTWSLGLQKYTLTRWGGSHYPDCWVWMYLLNKF